MAYTHCAEQMHCQTNLTVLVTEAQSLLLQSEDMLDLYYLELPAELKLLGTGIC